MEAKEKAQELVNQYDETLTYLESKAKAKQCALIAVDEIINSQKCCDECKEEGSIEMKYWNEVKHEIINL